MVHYLTYLFTVIGIGYFITESSLVKPIRERITTVNQIVKNKRIGLLFDKFDGVMNCIYCASFWIGIAVYYTMYLDFSKWTILYAFSCMGVIYIIKNIQTKN